jgi:hypothetical protein
MADRYFSNPYTLPLDFDVADIKRTLRGSVLSGLSVRLFLPWTRMHAK